MFTVYILNYTNADSVYPQIYQCLQCISLIIPMLIVYNLIYTNAYSVYPQLYECLQ